MTFPYRQFPHRFAGSDSERQAVGDPGHCEACVSVGHVEAHPDLGCADVGCALAHDEPAPPSRRSDPSVEDAAKAASAVKDWLTAFPPARPIRLTSWQEAVLLAYHQRKVVIR